MTPGDGVYVRGRDGLTDKEVEAALKETTERPPVTLAGHPCAGIYRLGAAPCGDFRLILARDLRGMKRSRRSLCQIHLRICRSFTGATGLEPATSGVTGRFEGHDG